MASADGSGSSGPAVSVVPVGEASSRAEASSAVLAGRPVVLTAEGDESARLAGEMAAALREEAAAAGLQARVAVVVGRAGEELEATVTALVAELFERDAGGR